MSETVEGTRLLWAIRAERDLLRAMVTWPEGANGVLAIGAYEAMARRLHKWVEADAAALRSEDAAPHPDPLFTFERLAAFPTAHPSPADAPAPQRPDPLAALLHDLYVSGPPYGCEHDLGPVGDYVPRCIEDAARLRAAGAAVHAITPECGPICWTTGHHHDVETCDGCRRLADMMHAAGMALATAHPSPADAPHRHVWVTTFGTGPDWQEHCATCPATRDVLAKEPTDD